VTYSPIPVTLTKSDWSAEVRTARVSRVVIADNAIGTLVQAADPSSAEVPGTFGTCFDAADRAKITGLLRPIRIGVDLSEEFHVHSEHSTDAVVVHRPEAKYVTR
jgi:hypothetical protein